MYDPTIGRWLSEDPIGFEAGDANLYRYVGNGPAIYVDPTGLFVAWPTLREYWAYFNPADDYPIDVVPYGDVVQVTAICAAAIGTGGVAGTGAATAASAAGAGSVVSAIIGGAVGGGVAGGVSGFPQGVPLQSAGEGAFIGGVSGGVLGKIGQFCRSAGATPRSAQFNEYIRFRNQGFTPAQSKYLTQPYGSRAGHHFPIPQRIARGALPDSILHSRFNVLRPQGINFGRFYELHYRVDPYFSYARFPNAIGGGWNGNKLGLQRYTGLQRVWFATPGPTKVVAGTGIVVVGTGGYWWLSSSKDGN
jgi:hypothetical protein